MDNTPNRIFYGISLIILSLLLSCQLTRRLPNTEEPAEGYFRARDIFEPDTYCPQCHSSTITELSNGDLLAAWWCGSFEGASDVLIMTARLPLGSDSWEAPVIAADIPGKFEGNPVLFSLPDGRLWLFFVVVDPDSPAMVQVMHRESSDDGYTWGSTEKFLTRPGIRTRNHPIVMQNGEILFPLFDQLLGQSLFLISGDLGTTWEYSDPIISDPPNVQPTVIERDDGSLYALMRTWHEDPLKRFLWQSESDDYGRTWSSPSYSEIPTVDSAIEMIKLANGHVVLAFNNGSGRERTPLTLALSLDEGNTWTYERNLEIGKGPFSYPSLVQTQNEHIHVIYTYRRKFIKHVEVNEEWIIVGE